ncbi:MAG: glycosyltransferase family 4 protein [Candidatus Methanospirareceae archaeon]
MKIVMVTTWFPPVVTGSGNRFYEIGRRLAKRHEIHVFTTGIRDCAREEEIEGMYVHRYGEFDMRRSMERGSYLFNLKFSLDILTKLHDNFDLIDCNIVSKTLPYASFLISRLSEATLIETWHEVWYKDNFKINPVMAIPGFFLEILIPYLPDFNIAVSETTKKRLIKLLHVQPRKVGVIPNGVDLEKFRAISVEKKQGRILYVGRLEKHKKVDALILSYMQLKRKYKDLELIIVGTGPEEERLRKMAADIEDVVFYAPMSYEKLVALMKSSWIFVLPSVKEGQGIVLLEAMAAGTPPIAVKAPGSGVVDVIKDGYNGILVSLRDIKEGMEKLLKGGDIYEELRRNGLEFVKEYDWDIIARKTEEVYKRAVEEKERGGS